MTHASRTVTPETLLGIDIFKTLSLTARERIAALAHGQRWQPGESIIAIEDTTHDVYFIASGTVRVTYCASSGREITFRDHAAGEMFGELSAIDSKPRSALVRALTETFIVALSTDNFRETLRHYPDLAATVLKHLIALVRALSDRVVEHTALDVRHRIRAELLRLARPDEEDPMRGLLTALPTHAEIARRISTHRESVTREITTLTKAGLVVRSGHHLAIPDLEKFRMLTYPKFPG